MTFEYMQYKTAKAWGKTPSEWALLSKKDKTAMMAFDKAENLIESWHGENMEKNIKNIKNKEKKGTQHPRRGEPRKHIDKRRKS